MRYYVSHPRMTVLVVTDKAGNITGNAPIIRKFIGQPLSNLTNWLRGCECVPLGKKPLSISGKKK